MPLLALTMGDPAGVGLELTLKIWRQAQSAARPHALVLYADPAAVAEYARRAGLADPCVRVADPREARAHWPARLPVIAIELVGPVVPGKPDPANAHAVIAAIEQATAAVVSGQADALVTNPIAKSV